MAKYKMIEKKNPLAVHALFDSRAAAERHLERTVPQYCARGYFMDKSLTPADFAIVGPGSDTVVVDVYGRPTACKLLAKHPAGTIDVERLSDGRCFRLSGLSATGS